MTAVRAFLSATRYSSMLGRMQRSLMCPASKQQSRSRISRLSLPPHMVVLGGGYVGLELAQAYRRFGSRVTVLEQGPQLMSREDRDVAEEIRRILSSEEIEFLLNTEVAEVRGRSGEGLGLTLRTGSGACDIEGSDILVAAGRVPNTAGIGLE